MQEQRILIKKVELLNKHTEKNRKTKIKIDKRVFFYSDWEMSYNLYFLFDKLLFQTKRFKLLMQDNYTIYNLDLNNMNVNII